MAGLSPGGLQTLWQLPVGATADGMRLEDQLSQGNDLENQAAGLKNLYDAQANPMRLSQLGLQNQTSAAQLPGIIADSKTKGAMAADDVLGPHVQALKAQYGANITKAHADQAAAAGQAMAQIGQRLDYDPTPGGLAAVKKQMEDAGLGKMWNPDWDQMESNPKNLADLGTTLKQVGSHIMDMTPKLYGAMQTGQQKIDAAQDMQDNKLDAQAQMQADRLAAQAQLAKDRAAAKGATAAGDPKTGVAFRNKYKAMAAALPDSDPRKLDYMQAVADSLQDDLALHNAGKADAPDMGALSGLPMKPAPMVNPAQQRLDAMNPNKPPANPTENANIQEAVIRAGDQYEPNKYDYRMGPNGVPQKKLKAQ